MPLYLGVDTSNYTTSAALYDSTSQKMYSEIMPLPVKKGEAGLRQSDAVFHHTRQLPVVMRTLFDKAGKGEMITAAAASVRPVNANGSYMPCFLCSAGTAQSIAAAMGIRVYSTSHQIGHILAALFGGNSLSLLSSDFIAVHVSGGTTDCLYCTPDNEELIKVTRIGSSLDLKAGQLIDRTGLMLGLDFPCGAELEKLAFSAENKIRPKAVIRDGSCCLSGFENKANELKDRGAAPGDIAYFVLSAVSSTVYAMIGYAREKYGELPVICAGGVMSDVLIKEDLEKRFKNIFFSTPGFSRDNAAGVALYAYYMNEVRKI